MELSAVFFDQDGVIIETEKDGHRVAFNKAFEEFRLGIEWGIDEYHRLLQVGGGKERMKHYFEKTGFTQTEFDRDPEGFIKKLHVRKTEIFIELIRTKKLPLRPGIRRVMEACNREGLFLAICTTSNEKAARAIIQNMLGGIVVNTVLAGDIVQRKKPDPEIYKLALEKAGVEPNNALVVEDSRIGVLAAKNAGIPVIATVNEYTQNEDTSAADLVVTSLGDPEGTKAQIINGNLEARFEGYITLEHLKMICERNS